MSAQGRDISETLSKLGSNYGIETLAQIMQLLNRRTIPQDEDEALIKHVFFSPLIDQHDTTVVFGQSDIESTEPVDHFSGWGMRKFIPDQVRAYDLTHDNTNADLITFPTPGIGDFTTSTIGRKNMGAAKTPGTEYMIINDNDWFNVTDEILIGGWANLPANSGADQYIVHKGTTQWGLKTMTGNVLRFEVEIASVTYNFDYTYTANTWFQFLAQAKSGTQELWIDDVLQDSGTQAGAIGTNSTNVGVFGTAAGASLLASTGALSWLTFANGFGDTAWLAHFFDDQFLDYDTDIANTPEEITTLPFIGSLQEMPNSFAGLFFAS